MKVDDQFINVYLDNRGLWTASLCEGESELSSLGGSYPKSNSARLDAANKWGRDFEVKTSYSPMFLTDASKEALKLLPE